MARCDLSSSSTKRTKERRKRKAVNIMESEDSDGDISYILDLDITGGGNSSNHEQDNCISNIDVSGVSEVDSFTADKLPAIKREADSYREDSDKSNSVSENMTENLSLSCNSSQPAGFLVVYFADEKSIAVVPQSWVKDELCSWPPIIAPQNIKQCVVRREPPKSSWQKIKIKILDSTDSYTKGCKKLKQAEKTLNLVFGTDTPNLNRKNKRKSCSPLYSSSPLSKTSNSQTVMPQSPRRLPESLLSAQVPEDHPSSPHLSESSISPSIAASMSTWLPQMLQICNHLPKPGNIVENKANEDFQKVFQMLEEIKSEIRDLRQILNSKLSTKVPDECPPLPLQQVEDVNEFESFISDGDNFTSVNNTEELKKFITDCLPTLTDDKIAALLKVTEEKGVKSVDDLKYIDPIKDFDGIVKPIPARKLKQKITNNLLEPCVDPKAICADNVSPLQIPLYKFPDIISQKLKNKERPTNSERRNVVRILIDHIMETIPAPRKKHLVPYAIELTNKFPDSFKDPIGDSTVDSGHISLLKQLVYRSENMQRVKTDTIRKLIIKSESDENT